MIYMMLLDGEGIQSSKTCVYTCVGSMYTCTLVWSKYMHTNICIYCNTHVHVLQEILKHACSETLTLHTVNLVHFPLSRITIEFHFYSIK